MSSRSVEEPAWRRAAERWLARWRRRHPVIGAVVAGSHVTGDPGPRSDLDIQVLLAPGTTWRERGNAVQDGFPIEYFANPARQVRRELTDERKAGRRHLATMYATGTILADDTGEVAALKAEARSRLRQRLPRAGGGEREQLRYRVWDMRDNVRDAVERGAPDTLFVFLNALAGLQETYARWLGEPELTPSKQHAVMTSARARTKYRMAPFGDPTFARLFGTAARLVDPAAVGRTAERIFGHVLAAMVGFDETRWRNRLPVAAGHPCLERWPDGFVIETERLLIRPSEARFARIINAAIHESATELQRWMPWAVPLPKVSQTRTHAVGAREKFDRREDCGLTIWRRADGAYLGNTGFHPRDPGVRALEIGYWCRTSETGKGSITETVRALAAVAIHHLGCRRLAIRCDADNGRSNAVARRAGFTEEGVLRSEVLDGEGTPNDCRHWSLVPGDAAVPPAESVRFGPLAEIGTA